VDAFGAAVEFVRECRMASSYRSAARPPLLMVAFRQQNSKHIVPDIGSAAGREELDGAVGIEACFRKLGAALR
jgi:hypothetical protein